MSRTLPTRLAQQSLTGCALLLALVACDEKKKESAAPKPAATTSAASGAGAASPSPRPLSKEQRKALKETAQYVSSAACTECHETEAQLYATSHHRLAMQLPTEETVLGNFDNQTLSYFGKTIRFTREGEKFLVHLDDEKGNIRPFEVKWTYGFTPLQQYLVETTEGRIQTIPFLWDSRPKEDGGQRWQHIYGDEEIAPADPLHWTRLAQNWNHMCADCHSTNVKKGFDEKTRTFETTFSELTVGCEACHGPGSVHIERAKAKTLDQGLGFQKHFRTRAERSWQFEKGNPIASLKGDPGPGEEPLTCAQCHSRRADFLPADSDESYFDRFRLSSLDSDLYFPDGQIKDEVYVFGSFAQSKMAQAGVICSDCHDSHSGKLLAEGNALCSQCHQPSEYDTPAHHFHEKGSEAATCTSCHMPERTYMQVDDRADHRFLVPRPLVSEILGSPDPCLSCHEDKSAKWAQAAIDKSENPRFSAQGAHEKWPQIFHAARSLKLDAYVPLEEILKKGDLPDLIRATGVTLLAEYVSPRVIRLLASLKQDPSALVRRAVAQVSLYLPAAEQARIVGPLLEDPIRSVRLEAVQVFLSQASASLPPKLIPAFRKVVEEFRETHEKNSDRPEDLMALAHLARGSGQPDEAIRLLRLALKVEPSSSAATISLAEQYREQGKEKEAHALLLGAVKEAADRGELHHALGLSFVRQKNSALALRHLEKAYQERPESRRYGYVYAVALADKNLSRSAALLDELLKKWPAAPELLQAQAGYLQKMGRAEEARRLLMILEKQVAPLR